MFKQEQDDLCWKQNGKYCDVIFSNVTGEWSTMYDNKWLEDGFKTRKQAYDSLRTYASGLNT